MRYFSLGVLRRVFGVRYAVSVLVTTQSKKVTSSDFLSDELMLELNRESSIAEIFM